MKEKGKQIVRFVKELTLNPTETLKNSVSKQSTTRDTIIFTLICACIMILCHLIIVILQTIVTYHTIQHLNYIDLIVKQFIIYSCMMFGIGAIYYGMYLYLNKETTYFQILKCTNFAMIPYMISVMLLPNIIGLFSHLLAQTLQGAGKVYSLLIFIELLQKEVDLKEKKHLIYFHTLGIGLIMFLYQFILL